MQEASGDATMSNVNSGNECRQGSRDGCVVADNLSCIFRTYTSCANGTCRQGW